MGAATIGTFWKLVLQRPLLGMLDMDLVVLRPRLKEPRLNMIELDGRPPPPCILLLCRATAFDQSPLLKLFLGTKV
jgi:hypothetical protein